MTGEVEHLTVVTGGTRGLGKELSLQAARAGSTVLAIYRSQVEAARELEALFKRESLAGQVLQKDLSRETLADSEIPLAKRIVCIHNAAPSFEPQPFRQIAWAEFEQQWRTALFAGVHLARLLLPRMAATKSGAFITVLTDALAENPPKGFAAYLSAKGALATLTRTLASEYAALGVRIFSVSPPFMETALTGGWNEHLRSAVLAKAKPKDPARIAQKILLLVNDPKTPGEGEDHRVD